MSTCHGCDRELPPNGAHRPRKWCSDTCRKRTLYAPRCADCGKPTSYGGGHRVSDERRCRSCAAAAATIWTRDAIVAAIRRWADLYGEPPAMADWNAWQARHIGNEARAQRFEQGRWPWFNTVIERFGSWNEAIAAAGFEPRSQGGGNGNCSRRRWRPAA